MIIDAVDLLDLMSDECGMRFCLEEETEKIW